MLQVVLPRRMRWLPVVVSSGWVALGCGGATPTPAPPAIEVARAVPSVATEKRVAAVGPEFSPSIRLAGTVNRQSDWFTTERAELQTLWGEVLADASRYQVAASFGTGDSVYAFSGMLAETGGKATARTRFAKWAMSASGGVLSHETDSGWDLLRPSAEQASPDQESGLAAATPVALAHCEFEDFHVYCATSPQYTAGAKRWLVANANIDSDSQLKMHGAVDLRAFSDGFLKGKPAPEDLLRNVGLLQKELPKLSMGADFSPNGVTLELLAPQLADSAVIRALLDSSSSKGATYNETFDRIPADASLVALMGEGARSVVNTFPESSTQSNGWPMLRYPGGTLAYGSITVQADVAAAKALFDKSKASASTISRVADVLHGYEFNSIRIPFSAAKNFAVQHAAKADSGERILPCPAKLRLPADCLVVANTDDLAAADEVQAKGKSPGAPATPRGRYLVGDGANSSWMFLSEGSPEYLAECIRNLLRAKPAGAASLRSTTGLALAGYATSRLGAYWSYYAKFAPGAATDGSQLLNIPREELPFNLGPSKLANGADALRFQFAGGRSATKVFTSKVVGPYIVIVAFVLALALESKAPAKPTK